MSADTLSPVAQETSQTSVRILIADDKALVRAGFHSILDAQDGIEVVGEAADGPRRSSRPCVRSPTSC